MQKEKSWTFLVLFAWDSRDSSSQDYECSLLAEATIVVSAGMSTIDQSLLGSITFSFIHLPILYRLDAIFKSFPTGQRTARV